MASSQLASQVGGIDFTPPTNFPHGNLNYLEILLQRTLTIFLFAGVCFILIYIVIGGIQWIQSSGDKAKLTAARQKVTWAIIGFIVLLLSYGIVGAVGFFFKVDLLRLGF